MKLNAKRYLVDGAERNVIATRRMGKMIKILTIINHE
jgi:hypothetical protein